MAELFGFQIRRKSEEPEQTKNEKSFVPPTEDDGAVVVSAGGVYGTYVDLEGSAKTEAELVAKYRTMAMHPEVDFAIDDIINEAIVTDVNEDVCSIVLDDIEYSENIKNIIREEYDNVLEMLNFKNRAYEIFRQWYVDGRLYYHAVIDTENPQDGIKELRFIDPRKIRKVREVKKSKDPGSQISLQRVKQEYYLYNEKGFNTNQQSNSTGTQGVRIAKDSIIHCTSGLMDVNSSLVLSYLHKAIKPLNNLRTLEDATIIYRVSRAPERRIFYIDVGNLPKMKAEQYLRDMMVKHKNKVVYDATTGEIRDDRKFMTMLEDYWLPRREGGRGTEITTLPGGQLTGELSDVEYFQKKLYQSLNVPVSRLIQESTFNLGRSTEITRDEVKFSKFVDRIRNRFSALFLKTLEKQLMLKGIINSEDWEQMQNWIKFDYARDNFFAELKDIDIMRERVQILRDMEDSAGKYYSHAWIRKNILQQTDDEIEEIDAEIQEEMQNPQYNPMIDQQNQQGEPNGPPPSDQEEQQ